MDTTFEVHVAAVRQECTDVRSFELALADADAGALPSFEPGAHIDVYAGDAGIRQYSLCDAPGASRRYRIAVKREDAGRGGSRWMHGLREGDVVRIGSPRNNFRLAASAPHHVLLAGGIGLTPLLSMAEYLGLRGETFTLGCFARSAAHLAFADRLRTAPWADRVRLHLDTTVEAQRAIESLLRLPLPGTQLYACGPAGFMDAVTRAASDWPAESIHTEHFTPRAAVSSPPAPQAFEVELARSGLRLSVPAERSLLSILVDAGVSVPTSCEQGLCGTCVTRFLSGDPEHGDSCLGAAERRTHVALCCARSRSALLVLDL